MGYVDMKKILLTLLLLILVFVSQSNSAVVNKIVGLNADCGNACQPIPLNVTVLCNDVSCPLLTAPSFTDEQRFWGSSGSTCKTSINGGITWLNCPTQPFSSGGTEYYAGTADGAVIGVARLSFPNEISIKRSVDNGVTWNTVYEDATNLLSGGSTSKVRCFLDGYCFVVDRDVASFRFFVLESTDNGQTWSVAFTKNNNDPPGINNGDLRAVQIKNFIDHTVVASPSNSYNNITRGMMKTNNVWNVTSLLGSGAVTCWGSFVFNNTPYGMCYDTQRRIVNLTTGLVEKSPTFDPPIYSGSGAEQGGMSYGYNSTTIYSLQQVVIGGFTNTGVYVSKDSGSSFVKIFNVNTNGLREADFWKHPINGCLYWSGGFSIVFGRIC
jgi:hypothetical protein